jgi:hypothetical protein
MSCTQTKLNSRYYFSFFLGPQETQENKSDYVLCPFTTEMAERLKRAPVVKVSLGVKKYVNMGGRLHRLPLQIYDLRRAKTLGINPSSLPILEAEDFDVVWDASEVEPHLSEENHWAAILEDTSTDPFQIVGYAYGNVIYPKEVSSMAEKPEKKMLTPEVQVTFVHIHPDRRGQSLCTLLMDHVFASIYKHFSTKHHIALFNIAKLPGYKCYKGAAERNKYKVTCTDEYVHPDGCQHMSFYP